MWTGAEADGQRALASKAYLSGFIPARARSSAASPTATVASPIQLSQSCDSESTR